jgi:hypothetical protein
VREVYLVAREEGEEAKETSYRNWPTLLGTIKAFCALVVRSSLRIPADAATSKSPGYTADGASKLPPTIAREQVGNAVVVTVVVTVETEVMVLAEGHVEGAAVHEALEITVTVDARGVIVVVAVQLEAMVGEVVEDFVEVLDEVTDDVVAANMQEQPELNFEGAALQGDRKVGNPVVAV